MKKYLEALINEQIIRGKFLKTIIPHPLRISELLSLAERCSRMIDEICIRLSDLQLDLKERSSDDIIDIYRLFRANLRDLEDIEKYGITALYHETKELEFLNKLIFKIHQEINLPLNPPAIACISTRYFFYHSKVNIIFSPIGESSFLLHLSDIFHEIGHHVISNKSNISKLHPLNKKFKEVIEYISDYYLNLYIQKIRETCPEDIPQMIKEIHSQWKFDWINEIFSDLFALFTLGPAYAWSHLHLTAKKTTNVYEFNPREFQTHPADYARFRALIIGLGILGYDSELALIQSKWNTLPYCSIFQPSPEYFFAFPEEILQKVTEEFLESLQDCKFKIVRPNDLKNKSQNEIVRVLNLAWEKFWNNSASYRDWEEEITSILRKNFGILD